MKILVTRPIEDAERTAALLEARGHYVLVAPLLEIRFADGPEIAFDGVQAILATSANGVRALARRSTRRDVPVFAVGPQTAEAARSAGFDPVKSADGDAVALADAVKGWAGPSAGALLHPAGAQTKGGLADALTAAGYAVQSLVLYTAEPVTDLPRDAAEAIRSGGLDAVLLFSPRSARSFVAAVSAAGLGEACRGIDALCISAATAAALAPLGFRRVAVAAHPDQDGVFALLA